MSIEERLDVWASQPGARGVLPAERQFITDMRAAARAGVGYGWMQQVTEWEWQDKCSHAWGPEFYEKDRAALQLEVAQAREKDATAIRAYYFTAYAKGFQATAPLWHELADETKQTYRDWAAKPQGEK